MPLIELDTTPIKVICSVEDCEEPFYGKMLCKKHWQKQYRQSNGTPARRYKLDPEDVDGLWFRIQEYLGAYGPNGRRIPI